ncbi:MAG TPA: hypothetical protein VFA26_02430, partial [Gemmataceae bacterium]|nr:hypothetical protein [Gemmataceae bacterium]
MDLSSLRPGAWRKLLPRGRPKRPIRIRQFRPSVEVLEDRWVPANLTWVGPAGGKWSVAANWAPAQVPGNGDILFFSGDTKNTDSTMDLGGGVFYHIAGLQIGSSYTKTITLQSSLYVDVLDMQGGTIDGAKSFIIWQVTQGTIIPATNFGTSFFRGGTIKTDVYTQGEAVHQVTLKLAGGNATPDLEANLTTDKYTTMEWRGGDMIVAGGKTITVNWSFLADSNGTIGNNTANWNLIINPGGALSRGKGTFNKVNETIKGKLFKVGSTIPGGTDVFVVIGSVTQDTGGTTEVQSGTLVVQGDFTQTSGSTIVDAGQTLSVTGNVFENGGTFTLAGGTLSATTVQIAPGAELGGSGTIAADVTNAGVIDVGGSS